MSKSKNPQTVISVSTPGYASPAATLAQMGQAISLGLGNATFSYELGQPEPRPTGRELLARAGHMAGRLGFYLSDVDHMSCMPSDWRLRMQRLLEEVDRGIDKNQSRYGGFYGYTNRPAEPLSLIVAQRLAHECFPIREVLRCVFESEVHVVSPVGIREHPSVQIGVVATTVEPDSGAVMRQSLSWFKSVPWSVPAGLEPFYTQQLESGNKHEDVVKVMQRMKEMGACK